MIHFLCIPRLDATRIGHLRSVIEQTMDTLFIFHHEDHEAHEGKIENKFGSIFVSLRVLRGSVIQMHFR
jgi:hypothetical protein